METASLKLANELFNLSGWKSELLAGSTIDKEKFAVAPPYSLGYLVRKLEKYDLALAYNFGAWKGAVYGETPKGYTVLASADADTPENVTCGLAIELFKQGVLTQ